MMVMCHGQCSDENISNLFSFKAFRVLAFVYWETAEKC